MGLDHDDAGGEFRVRNAGNDYEISNFLKYHPGGTNTVASYKNLDIGAKLAQYDHSAAAMYLLREYKVADGGTAQEPEDLEKLVDWSKPMLEQVGKLGDKYYDWMSSPVDRKLRLFESDILEMMTVTPWFLVPAIWVPASMGMLYHGYYHQNSGNISLTAVVITFLAGVALWSLLEYTLHRFLFHRKPPADSPRLITLHFTIHGLHHKVPFDDRRLLFPPVPAAIAIIPIYTILSLVLPAWLPSLLGAGVLSGYVGYDLTHYYLHYGSPKADTYLYHMKRYHNRHHFTHQDTGFGISTDIWDRVFGTEILLKRLKQTLKW